MAYIMPDTNVWLLKGCPLDKDYNHTLYFNNATEQINTFLSMKKYAIEKHSYQRKGAGVIRVKMLADNLYDCNYMVFQNTAFGNKYFYAFIDSVEYINPNCTAVYYTIDVMQTWYFDYELGKCFVEREHVSSDAIGEHIVPEPVNGGTYSVKRYDKSAFSESLIGDTNDSDFTVIILYTANVPILQGQNDVKGKLVNGVYTPCWFVKARITGNGTEEEVSILSDYVDLLVQENAVIVGMYAVPTCFAPPISFDAGDAVKTFTKNVYQNDSFKGLTTTGDYVPRNKKLYTSQYNYLCLSNNTGVNNKFSWEQFERQGVATFEITGCAIPSPEVLCYPTDYRGVEKDYDSGVPYKDFPMLNWSEDSFSRWWAQNGTSFAIQTLSSALAVGGGIVTGQYWIAAAGAGALASTLSAGEAAMNSPSSFVSLNSPFDNYVHPMYLDNLNNGTARINATHQSFQAQRATINAGIGASALHSVTSALSTLASAANLTDVVKGSNTGGTLLRHTRSFGYTFYDVGVCGEECKIIDEYLDMFGYQVNAVKVPNIRDANAIKRPSWNYVKTAGCVIHAASGKGLPADDEHLIAKIYDKGITFWNNKDDVGNYDGSRNMLP